MLLRLQSLQLAGVSLIQYIVACALSPGASAELVNITVDDWYRDPIDKRSIDYIPAASWKLWYEAACSDCEAHPDPTHAYEGTWHEGIQQENGTGAADMYASFDFEGVAVYVYCIVPRSSNTFPESFADMTFVLDGEQVGTFTGTPSGALAYEYNVSVYANASLPAGQHTIQLYNGISSHNQSIVLLDYIIYTRDTSKEPLSSSVTFSSATTASLPNAPGTAVSPTLTLDGTSSGLGTPNSVPLFISIIVPVGAVVIVAL